MLKRKSECSEESEPSLQKKQQILLSLSSVEKQEIVRDESNKNGDEQNHKMEVVVQDKENNDQVNLELQSSKSKEIPQQLKFNKECLVCESKEVTSRYQIGKQLGEGGFGAVYLVIEKVTGIQRAMKVLLKQQVQQQQQSVSSEEQQDNSQVNDSKQKESQNVEIGNAITNENNQLVAPKNVCEMSQEDYQLEVDMLKQLDHPNILRIYEFGEEGNSYFMITELVRDGSLFDTLYDKKQDLTIDHIKSIIKQILIALKYAHAQGVVHRDLKSENILLSFDENLDNYRVKIIDWGLSALCPNTHLQLDCGTIQFKAPEVIQQSYNNKCDIWSTGVILYELISKQLPFEADTEEEVEELILQGGYNLTDTITEMLSKDGINFLKQLLTFSPIQRPSASQALEHPWLAEVQKEEIKQNKLLKSLNRMREFKSDKFLLKFALAFFALHTIPENERTELTSLFNSMDKDNDGQLTKQEIFQALEAAGIQSAEKVAEDIMKQADLDNNGKIEYSEFLAAAMKKYTLQDDQILQKAFNAFDTDGDGQISLAEIRSKIQKSSEESDHLLESRLEEIINEADSDGNKSVSFEEFKQLIVGCLDKEDYLCSQEM